MLVIRQTGLELPAHAHVVERRADDGLQGLALEGLGEVVEGACREASRICSGEVAAVCMITGMDRRRSSLDLLQQHDAVHARHHAIQEHEIEATVGPA
jgi:hypothetical protein